MSAKLGKDVFREILMRMDDKTLLKTCKIDRETYHDVCDDQFFHRRLQQKYPDTLLVKPDYMNYRQYFLNVVYHVAKLKEDFNYEYKSGDLKRQYGIFYSFFTLKDTNSLLIMSAQRGELALVKYAIENGADVHIWNDEALVMATENRHLDIIKYLVEQGANIHTSRDWPLTVATERKYTEIVDYLSSIIG